MNDPAVQFEPPVATPDPLTFTCDLRRIRRGHGHAFTDKPKPPPRVPVRRPAKVAHLLAWAHKAQRQIDTGQFETRSHLAHHLGVTKARVSQILDLTLLAPAFQEELLFLEAIDGKEPVSERSLREVVGMMDWAAQYELSCKTNGLIVKNWSPRACSEYKTEGDEHVQIRPHRAPSQPDRLDALP